MSKLPVLVRLHKGRLDEARAHLAACEEARAALVAGLRELDEALIIEQGAARRTLDGGRAYPPFARRTTQRSAALERRLAEATIAVDQAGELMAERFRDLKTLELAVAAEAAAKRAAEARREQATLDEIGADRARRAAAESRS